MQTKRQYKVQYAVDFHGDRLDPKSQVDLTEDEASALGDAVAPVKAPAGVPIEKETDELSVPELRARCRELGLPSDGSKADMLDRIRLSGKLTTQTHATRI